MKRLLDQGSMKQVLEVFWIFLRLGCTSFGGPIAHLGYFQNELIAKKKWMDDSAYADLVALCQFLPGPASSQVGMALGLSRAGIAGAIAAWLGFTLPSAILLVLFALGLAHFQNQLDMAWIHGLKIAAVAVVAQALLSMFPKLCPDKERVILALLTAIAATLLPTAGGQIIALLGVGLWGFFFFKDSKNLPHRPQQLYSRRKIAVSFLAVFFILLILLPVGAALSGNQGLKYFDSFFRAGSLVFGGGHVVLPLLQSEIVHQGWISQESFMAGYGAAQAVPGPLFTFAAYLGAAASVPPTGWWGAALCLIAVFLPSFLLIVGVLPFWEKLRSYPKLRTTIAAINAGVVGLLLAAFYNPVVTNGILNTKDFILALICAVLLVVKKWPSWAVVLLGAAGAGLF